MKLTKDADRLICEIYRYYLTRRQYGASKSDAREFYGGSSEIQTNCMPKWSFEDVDDTIRELSAAGLLYADYSDDNANYAYLTDDAIIYMENRFKNGLKDVIDYIGSITQFVP